MFRYLMILLFTRNSLKARLNQLVARNVIVSALRKASPASQFCDHGYLAAYYQKIENFCNNH